MAELRIFGDPLDEGAVEQIKHVMEDERAVAQNIERSVMQPLIIRALTAAFGSHQRSWSSITYAVRSFSISVRATGPISMSHTTCSTLRLPNAISDVRTVIDSGITRNA